MLKPKKHIGHIFVKGTNVTKSIYMNKQATKAIFNKEGWLKTGDCGAVVNGQLIITGREKESSYTRPFEQCFGLIANLRKRRVRKKGLRSALFNI